MLQTKKWIVRVLLYLWAKSEMHIGRSSHMGPQMWHMESSLNSQSSLKTKMTLGKEMSKHSQCGAIVQGLGFRVETWKEAWKSWEGARAKHSYESKVSVPNEKPSLHVNSKIHISESDCFNMCRSILINNIQNQGWNIALQLTITIATRGTIHNVCISKLLFTINHLRLNETHTRKALRKMHTIKR